MPSCPNGHQSGSSDYCDVCGAPIAAVPPMPAPVAPSKPADLTCPNCGAPNAPETLFCESCGYDFTTGAKPRTPSAPSLLDLDSPLPPPPAPARPAASEVNAGPEAPVKQTDPEDAGERVGTPEEQIGTVLRPESKRAASAAVAGGRGDTDPARAGLNGSAVRPAGLPSFEPTPDPAADARIGTVLRGEPSSQQPSLELPAPQQGAEGSASPAQAVPSEAVAGSVPGPTPAAGGSEQPLLPAAVRSRATEPLEQWNTVAEVWIDPDWYRMQQTDDDMPSPGLPIVVPLKRTRALIGRVSRSRGIEPEVDCGVDSSVSRRQAELSTDGTRWWVEDLGSANGTYVGAASQPLPTAPIPKRTELIEGDRIYVGAWTRIVLRRATPDEHQLYA